MPFREMVLTPSGRKFRLPSPQATPRDNSFRITRLPPPLLPAKSPSYLPGKFIGAPSSAPSRVPDRSRKIGPPDVTPSPPVANQSQENREVFLTPEYVWYSV